ncbi:putative toxin-antitoxin system toxin component, PIN family [Ferrovibrio sp.]|uniref:putative toxin-antitoxin system toxin component, PIN family n=1 Tax=Ferrovibrio sp. TaxID=1917215 RepID=UPI00260BF6C7|nr:putative toxin-antitoxin system toxin component, PIN family [Ferrovibrio sp.]
MKRVVLDSSVLVAGLRSHLGASNALLRQVALGRIQPLCTTALFLEYEAVLVRAEHRLVHGLDEAGVARFLAAFAAAATAVEVHFLWRPQLQDATDEMVLEAAVNGRADMIVTHNQRHFSGAAEKFGIAVLPPARLLKEIEP